MSDSVDAVNREIVTAGEIVEALCKGTLRREPDISGLRKHVAALKERGLLPVVQNFLGSSEFKSIYSEAPPGLKLNFGPRNEVQTGCPDEDRIKLWRHIQEVWTKLGVFSPVGTSASSPLTYPRRTWPRRPNALARRTSTMSNSFSWMGRRG
jgi:hypothetical protein